MILKIIQKFYQELIFFFLVELIEDFFIRKLTILNHSINRVFYNDKIIVQPMPRKVNIYVKFILEACLSFE